MIQKPAKPPVANQIETQPGIRRWMMNVLLVLSFLFLYPTLTWLVRRPFIKTTVQSAHMREFFEDHICFLISLLVGYIGILIAKPRSHHFYLFLFVFLLCTLVTGVLAPGFLFFAVVLSISLIYYLFIKKHPRNNMMPISIALALFIFYIWIPPVFKASTRSRTARVKGDMRSMTIALEMYYQEFGELPPTTKDNALKADWHSTCAMPTFRAAQPGGPPPLTSPVSYLTALFIDPFRFLDEDRTFAYACRGPYYIVVSAGPNCVFDLTPVDLEQALKTMTPDSSPPPLLIERMYDPSNGAESVGDMWRVRQ